MQIFTCVCFSFSHPMLHAESCWGARVVVTDQRGTIRKQNSSFLQRTVGTRGKRAWMRGCVWLIVEPLPGQVGNVQSLAPSTKDQRPKDVDK